MWCGQPNKKTYTLFRLVIRVVLPYQSWDLLFIIFIKKTTETKFNLNWLLLNKLIVSDKLITNFAIR